MKALLYLMRRSFINYLKSLRKKPLKAVGPIFMIIFIVIFLIPRKAADAAAGQVMAMVFVIGFTVFAVASLLYSFHKGTKRLKSYFLMSDVNLIFPSPIMPQTVLLYGLVKQIAMEMLVSFWFIYQIPNILSNFNVSPKNQIMLILAFILFQIVFCNCLKLLIFALCARFKGLASLIRWTVKVLAITLIAVPALFVYVNRNQMENVERAARSFYESNAVAYIPVIGWMKEMAYQSINHMGSSFIIYILLLIALCGVFIYITYGIELDYYEDVLSMAEDNEIMKMAKTGKLKQGDVDYLNRSGKGAKIFVNPLRKVRLQLDGVYGSKVFFYKHMNEYFKRGLWFINFYTILFTGLTLIYALTPVKEIRYLLFGLSIMLMYSTLGNKIQNEIGYHYIYMIPDEPEKKLFYGSIASLIKVGVDALMFFVPSGIMMRSSIFEIILCIAAYLSFGVLCTFSGLFAFKIGGRIGLLASPVLFSLFLLLFQSLMVVPNVIAVVAVTLNLKDFGSFAIYFAILLVNTAGSAGLIYGCRSLLNNMEQHSFL